MHLRANPLEGACTLRSSSSIDHDIRMLQYSPIISIVKYVSYLGTNTQGQLRMRHTTLPSRTMEYIQRSYSTTGCFIQQKAIGVNRLRGSSGQPVRAPSKRKQFPSYALGGCTCKRDVPHSGFAIRQSLANSR